MHSPSAICFQFEMFSRELGPISWALATPHGTLYNSSKSKLLEDLEKDIPAIHFPTYIALVLDTFANIQKLAPISDNRKPLTFTKVAQSILYAVYDGIAPQPTKIDLVVENYFPLSIKNIEREKKE